MDNFLRLEARRTFPSALFLTLSRASNGIIQPGPPPLVSAAQPGIYSLLPRLPIAFLFPHFSLPHAHITLSFFSQNDHHRTVSPKAHHHHASCFPPSYLTCFSSHSPLDARHPLLLVLVPVTQLYLLVFGPSQSSPSATSIHPSSGRCSSRFRRPIPPYFSPSSSPPYTASQHPHNETQRQRSVQLFVPADQESVLKQPGLCPGRTLLPLLEGVSIFCLPSFIFFVHLEHVPDSFLTLPPSTGGGETSLECPNRDLAL